MSTRTKKGSIAFAVLVAIFVALSVSKLYHSSEPMSIYLQIAILSSFFLAAQSIIDLRRHFLPQKFFHIYYKLCVTLAISYVLLMIVFFSTMPLVFRLFAVLPMFLLVDAWAGLRRLNSGGN